MTPAKRFVAERARQTHERNPRPWDRFAHHVLALRRRVEALARELHLPPQGRVLDFGCATQPYRHLFARDVDYVGADLPGNELAQLTIGPDGRLPAPDASFDAVISTQVLEHVDDPRTYLAECQRLLRGGGRLLLTTHGTFRYHPDPDDLWRWTGPGLRRELQNAGFKVIHLEGIVGMLPSGLQMIQDALEPTRPRLRQLLALIFQSLMRATDRLHDDDASRARDAQVFALVAEKP